jgi:hypothetical protein
MDHCKRSMWRFDATMRQVGVQHDLRFTGRSQEVIQDWFLSVIRFRPSLLLPELMSIGAVLWSLNLKTNAGNLPGTFWRTSAD